MPIVAKPEQLLSFIGAIDAKLTLYLPNPPVIRQTFNRQKADLNQLIEDNGNHWRKILTILAKLSCAKNDWKAYRDGELLHHQEMISFADALTTNRGWHLIAGKASWQRLGFDEQQFTPLDAQGRAYYHQQVILMPYPDYRQLPNQLIAQLVELMDLAR
jgi:hypothetical protein